MNLGVHTYGGRHEEPEAGAGATPVRANLLAGGACPRPLDGGDTIQLAHGGGGRLMGQLIEQVFRPAFAADARRHGLDAAPLHDGAVLPRPEGRIALSTDAYVVRPLFFPGGDIGTLAVNGTVNDLAMCGARPLSLTAAFILEEGLAVDTVARVATSMAAAAAAVGVDIVAGDTKVVGRGQADGLYVSTAGVGVVPTGVEVSPEWIRTGDAILVSGDLGRHGIAVMAEREGLEFDSGVASDCAPVVHLVAALLEAGIQLHCARDLTRGGLSSALVELATTASVRLELDEAAVPILEPVRGACEMLGLDPLYVACEGRFCAFVAAEQATAALEVLHSCSGGEAACRIGTVAGPQAGGRVLARSLLGVDRVIDLFRGEQLPRIC